MRILSMRTFFFLLSILVLNGCAHSVHVVNASSWDQPAGSAKIVEAKAEQLVIMGFVQQTDYVDEARASLLDQCKGDLTGVTTEYRTSLGFFSWRNKVIMRGFCAG